jgi:UDP-glucuronate 4-epimerase
MRILITGGRGFIGTHLAAALRAAGHNVVTVDKKPLRYGQIGSQDIVGEVSIYLAELSTQSGLKAIYPNARPFEIIFHLADISQMTLGVDRPGVVLHNNVRTIIDVLEYARHTLETRVIFLSCGSVEFADRSISPFTLSKKIGEEICQTYRFSYNIPVSIVRLFNVYGPGEANYGQYSTLIKACKESVIKMEPITIFGDGSVIRDFTYIDDAVDGLIRVMNETALSRDLYELGMGQNNVSVLDIVSEFRKRSGCTFTFAPSKVWDAPFTLANQNNWPSGWEPTGDVLKYINEWFDAGCPSD